MDDLDELLDAAKTANGAPAAGRDTYMEIEYRSTNDLGSLFAALAKAQGKIRNAPKDAANPHFRSKYADLASISDACRAALSENGIAVMQIPYNDGNNVGVVTRLGHASGQWIEGRLKVAPVKYDAQGIGSVMTYLRRYSLAAMAGVAPGDDDDGEGAVGRGRDDGRAPMSAPADNGGKISAEQKEWLVTLLKETDADVKRFLSYLGVPALDELPAARYNDAVAALSKKKRKTTVQEAAE